MATAPPTDDAFDASPSSASAAGLGGDPGDGPRRGQARFDSTADGALPFIAGIAAVAAVFTGQQPTANALADLVLSAGFAASIVLLARRVPPRVVVLSAALALMATGLQFPVVAPAGVGLAVALAAAQLAPLTPDRRTTVKLAAAAILSFVVLQLPNLGFDGSASLVAGVAVVPVLVAGVGALEPARRRVVRRVALGAFGFAVVAGLLSGIAALSARGSVEDGIADAEAGVDALEAGDQPQALALLGTAQHQLASASDWLSGPLTWPARIVPVLAQHTRALGTAADQGEILAATAVRTVTTADVERIRGRNGSIDIGLIREVDGELTNANLVLRLAQGRLGAVRTPWLVSALDDRLASVENDLADIVGDIDLANHATSVMPGILGADRPRTYMVLFVQPAEGREFGGFVGAYGLLGASDGRVELIESGSIDVDLGSGEAAFTNAGEFPEGYFAQRPFAFPQNLTATADLATIAAAARDLTPQWRQDPDFVLDGVITIDPYALAGLLELTGPIPVSGRDEPLGADNVVEFLLRGQYREFDAEQRDERQDALRELAGAAFARLLNIDLAGPERLGEIFGPLARGDRIAFTTFDDDENAFLRRIFLDADLPVVGDAVQMLGVYSQTAVAGKLDAYATRDLQYVVDIDPATGAVHGSASITFENHAPSDAGPYVLGHVETVGVEEHNLAIGDNLLGLYVYSRSELSKPRSHDAPFEYQEVLPAYSYQRHEMVLEVGLGQTSTVVFETDAAVLPGRYDLVVMAQAVAEIGEFDVTILPVEGWRVIGEATASDGSIRFAGRLDAHQTISVEFERID